MPTEITKKHRKIVFFNLIIITLKGLLSNLFFFSIATADVGKTNLYREKLFSLVFLTTYTYIVQENRK